MERKKKTATEYYKEKLEERRRILFPLTILKSDNLNKLDTLLDERNEIGLRGFWNNPNCIEGRDALEHISEELKNRNNVSKDDLELIEQIVKDYKKFNPSFDLSGSTAIFLQIEKLNEDLKKVVLSDSLNVALLFWIYLTLIESTINDLSEIFLEIAKKKGDKSFIKKFDEKLKKGGHFLFGQMKEYAIKWKYTTKDKKTFLHKSNLRNEIAHANIWYDDSRKKILLRGRKELTIKDFKKEFERIYDFFKELLFQLNNSDADLLMEVDKLRNKISREFLKIIRSGPKRKIWKNEVKFEWEKETSK